MQNLTSMILVLTLCLCTLAGCNTDSPGRQNGNQNRHNTGRHGGSHNEKQSAEDESEGEGQGVAEAAPIPANALTANDDHEILEAQSAHERNVEVTARVEVKKVLRDDLEGSRHQRFILELSNDTTVLVAHNIDMAPKIPIHPGDSLVIHGAYIWKEQGGVIHWTHHSDTPRHESGFVDFNGFRYQ